MKISKRQLRRIIRESCGDSSGAAIVPMAPLPAEAMTETVAVSPVDVLAEMASASEALDVVLESMQAAAALCPECGPEVAVQAPVVEAMVVQAEALQEMLDAQADILAENAGVSVPGELDFTGDVGTLPGGEAFAIGLQAGQEGLA